MTQSEFHPITRSYHPINYHANVGVPAFGDTCVWIADPERRARSITFLRCRNRRKRNELGLENGTRFFLSFSPYRSWVTDNRTEWSTSFFAYVCSVSFTLTWQTCRIRRVNNAFVNAILRKSSHRSVPDVLIEVLFCSDAFDPGPLSRKVPGNRGEKTIVYYLEVTMAGRTVFFQKPKRIMYKTRFRDQQR